MFRIVDKKIFTIFIAVVLVVLATLVYGVYYLISHNYQKNYVQVESQADIKTPVNSSVVIENPIMERNVQIDNEDDNIKKDVPRIVTEYENQVYGYKLSFPEKWYMNDDDSRLELIKEKQDDGTFLEFGGQAYWSNYADINKYSPQSKPDDFRLLGLTVYSDKSDSIDNFAKKIGIGDSAVREEFKTSASIDGIQYVSPGLVDKNPSIVMIFKKDGQFFVFRPAFLYGDIPSSDAMESIVKSFGF